MGKGHKFAGTTDYLMGDHLIEYAFNGCIPHVDDRVDLWIDFGCGINSLDILNKISFAKRVIGQEINKDKISKLEKNILRTTLYEHINSYQSIHNIKKEKNSKYDEELSIVSQKNRGFHRVKFNSKIQLYGCRDSNQLLPFKEKADIVTFFGVLNQISLNPHDFKNHPLEEKIIHARSLVNQAYNLTKEKGVIASSVNSYPFSDSLKLEDEINLFEEVGFKDITYFKSDIAERTLLVGRK